MAGSGTLILASASPRRAELLTQIGVQFRVAPSDFDESLHSGETPERYVCRMARGKAKAVAGLVSEKRRGKKNLAGAQPENSADAVLGADTVVVLDDRILGKPTSNSDARTMLHNLAGRRHQVMSAVAVVTDVAVEEALTVTDVWFRALNESEIDRYVALGEGSDKAGGYAIQGYGAVFVDRIQGSYSGVVGLPLDATHRLLARVGIPFWRA